ncbi:hypothetical protein BDR22DRAFT_887645 [Usnea florida]
MKRILYHLPNSFLLLSAAVISPPLILSNSSGLASTAANVSVTTPADPRFSITARFEETRLPPIPCLMNTVKILEKLAMEDFWAGMARSLIKFDDYAHVGVVVSPQQEGGRIEHRFVIWGLGRGVTNMVLLNKFQQATFALFWEGREVGTVQLVPWPETQSTNQTVHTNSTLNLTQQSNLPLVQDPSSLPASIIDTPTPPENARMTLQMLLTETSIFSFNVFLVAIAVIVDLAPRAATSALNTYKSPQIAANIVAVFQEPPPERTSPPFFEVQWLISAVAMVPEYMIRKGRFKEAYAFIDVDGVRVANGFLGANGWGGDLAGGTGNVSLS